MENIVQLEIFARNIAKVLCEFVQHPFHERWKLIEKEVNEPRQYEQSILRGRVYDYQAEPFSVRTYYA